MNQQAAPLARGRSVREAVASSLSEWGTVSPSDRCHVAKDGEDGPAALGGWRPQPTMTVGAGRASLCCALQSAGAEEGAGFLGRWQILQMVG